MLQPFPAVQGQDAVGRNLAYGFAVLLVQEEILAGPFVRHQFRCKTGPVPQRFAGQGTEGGLVGDVFRYDPERPLPGGGRIGNILPGIHEGGAQGGRRFFGILLEHDAAGQRFQPFLAGQPGLGLLLGPVGQVEVLQLLHLHGLLQLLFQSGGQFPLSGHGLQDFGTPFFQVAQVLRPRFHLADLFLVEGPRPLFAVPRDEGDRVPSIEQFQGHLGLPGLYAELLREERNDLIHGFVRRRTAAPPFCKPGCPHYTTPGWLLAGRGNASYPCRL